MEWCSRPRVVQFRASRRRLPGNQFEAVGGDTVKGREIFRASRAVCECPNVLVCKLVDGKITYIHRRLWPALIKLASRFGKERLARVWDEHTKSGAHVSRQIIFPDWVPLDVMEEAQRLSTLEAERILSTVLNANTTSG